jgi:hypothetical protein
MRRIATIGVYGFTAGAFLEKLTAGGVGLLLDLRQRRGVRGPDYSWANSARLQRALAAADIGWANSIVCTWLRESYRHPYSPQQARSRRRAMMES